MPLISGGRCQLAAPVVLLSLVARTGAGAGAGAELSRI